MKLGYKYRLYLTQDQKDYMAKIFGCTRFVYNWGLRKKTDAFYNDKVKISQNELSGLMTLLKREKDTLWLQEVPHVVLAQALRQLDKAFVNFYKKRARYPKFKNKFDRQSATYGRLNVRIKDNKIVLPKMQEPIKIKWSRKLPSEFSSATVTKDNSDRYFISFICKKEVIKLPNTDNKVGIDLGIKDIIVDSNGNSSGNPKFIRKYERQLRRAQQKLSRRKKGSKNRLKAKDRVAKVHAKIADSRNDFVHKMTTKLIKENGLIVMEDLQVKNMMRNHCLAKSIADVAWGAIEKQAMYKAKLYGRELVKIDKFFPSSKRCSNCGFILKKLDLSVRKWICPECKNVNLRDVNAAKNILQAGQAILAGCDLVRQDKTKCTEGLPETL
jgi:putative transposase